MAESKKGLKMMNEKMERCETCVFFNDEPCPCVCKKGYGEVSFRRLACDDYKEKKVGVGKEEGGMAV